MFVSDMAPARVTADLNFSLISQHSFKKWNVLSFSNSGIECKLTPAMRETVPSIKLISLISSSVAAADDDILKN